MRWFWLVCLWFGCVSQPEVQAPDTGTIAIDGAEPDAAESDAADPDAGVPNDASVEIRDASPIDASTDAASPDAQVDAGPVVLEKAYTEHLGRLTHTARNPINPLGLIGTDLGASFERAGQIVFLFGDSWLTGPDLSRWDDDSAAWTELVYPSDGSLPQLRWFEDAGSFRSLLVSGVNLKAYNVPVEAVVVGNTTYVFFTTGFSQATGRHTHSVLTHESGDFSSFTVDHSVPSDKFLNVSIVEDGGELWIFGSGHYRQSAVYLAKVAPGTLADRSTWTYYRGDVQPLGPDEASAEPIVASSCVGELSVRKHPSLGLYLMTYNCDSVRGIHLHYAPSPLGPWSEPIIIFDPAPDRDRGYQYFMHAHRDFLGFDDGLSEVGRENEWGGEYGPYLVPQWFTSESGVHSIVYALSSWNPYQVHLMRTVLTESGTIATRPERGVGLPRASLVNADFSAGTDGWQASGDAFAVFGGADGRPRLTTYVLPAGDAAVGRLWQDFTVDSLTSEISFDVHGGSAHVELVRGNDVVRSTGGKNENSPDLPVRWQLSDYRGETLQLMIRDDETGPWGFIGTTGFELR